MRRMASWTRLLNGGALRVNGKSVFRAKFEQTWFSFLFFCNVTGISFMLFFAYYSSMYCVVSGLFFRGVFRFSFILLVLFSFLFVLFVVVLRMIHTYSCCCLYAWTILIPSRLFFLYFSFGSSGVCIRCFRPCIFLFRPSCAVGTARFARCATPPSRPRDCSSCPRLSRRTRISGGSPAWARFQAAFGTVESLLHQVILFSGWHRPLAVSTGGEKSKAYFFFLCPICMYVPFSL